MKANIGWYWIYNDSQWHYFNNNESLCDSFKRLAETRYVAKPSDHPDYLESDKICKECEGKI